MPECDTGLVGPLVFATVVGGAACVVHPARSMATAARPIQAPRVPHILVTARNRIVGTRSLGHHRISLAIGVPLTAAELRTKSGQPSSTDRQGDFRRTRLADPGAPEGRSP